SVTTSTSSRTWAWPCSTWAARPTRCRCSSAPGPRVPRRPGHGRAWPTPTSCSAAPLPESSRLAADPPPPLAPARAPRPPCRLRALGGERARGQLEPDPVDPLDLVDVPGIEARLGGRSPWIGRERAARVGVEIELDQVGLERGAHAATRARPRASAARASS